MERSNAAERDVHHGHAPASQPREPDDGWQTFTKPDKGKAKLTQSVPNESSNSSKRLTAISGPHNSLQAHNKPPGPQGIWQDARGRAPQPQQAPRAVKLIEDDGNEAQASWRALRKAKTYVRIPRELIMHDLAGGNTLQRITVEHLTFIARDEGQASNSESQTFGIWGVGKDAEATRTAIAKWIEEMTGPKKSDRCAKFAKLMSMTSALRQRAENRWKREVKRQRYRQHPPMSTAFGAIGMFHWPVNDYNAAEILGTHYEALDPIRMDCECYIVWKKTGFQVMGKDMDVVKEALLRLKQTVFQIAAKQLPTVRV